MIIKQGIEQIGFSASANTGNDFNKTVVLSNDKSVQIYVSFNLHNDLHLIFLPQTALLLDTLYPNHSKNAIGSSNIFAASGKNIR
jgi:hypothetical protein